MSAVYETELDVGFQHCDPAGIVFYPRYFEMINTTVERWCAEALDWPFARMHLVERVGVPMASINVDFRAPSRLGDRLIWRLEVMRVGGSSVELRVSARGDGEERLSATATLVFVDMAAMRPTRWPQWFRDKVEGEKK